MEVKADSSPVVSKLSLVINYLLGKRLGYARGKVIHFVKIRARSSLPRRILIMRDEWGRVRRLKWVITIKERNLFPSICETFDFRLESNLTAILKRLQRWLL